MSGISFTAAALEITEYAKGGLSKPGEAVLTVKTVALDGKGTSAEEKNKGGPAKPLWEQLEAQRKAAEEEAAELRDPKRAAPKGLDEEELEWLQEQAQLKEEQERSLFALSEQDKLMFAAAKAAKLAPAATSKIPKAAGASAAGPAAIVVPRLARRPAAGAPAAQAPSSLPVTAASSSRPALQGDNLSKRPREEAEADSKEAPSAKRPKNEDDADAAAQAARRQNIASEASKGEKEPMQGLVAYGSDSDDSEDDD
jgi:FAM192A/Fyv6, N-terminal domain